MTGGGGLQLAASFRQCDVQGPLAACVAVTQELQGERGLAGARLAFDEMDVRSRVATAQDVVEAVYAGW